LQPQPGRASRWTREGESRWPACPSTERRGRFERRDRGRVRAESRLELADPGMGSGRICQAEPDGRRQVIDRLAICEDGLRQIAAASTNAAAGRVRAPRLAFVPGDEREPPDHRRPRSTSRS
jgi:hypothetical protein